jgi:LPXTG-motif cell wall-anchored protein
LANGQEHEFRVAATNRESGVVSEWSTVVKATPTAPTSTTSTSVAPEGVVSDASIKTSDKTITITTDATTINCDKACYDAIAAGLGVTDGPVYVSIDGGERIALDGAQYTTIPVGKSAKKLSFMTVKDDVVQQISLDVKRDGQAATSSSKGGTNSSSSSNTLLFVALGLGLIVLIWFFVARRRRDEEESTTNA